MTETTSKTTNQIETDEPAPSPDDSIDLDESTPPPRRRFRRRLIWVVGALITLVLMGWGVYHYLYALAWESTDDAFIDGDIYSINPRISGYVAAVHVNDNQWVEQGQLLVELDRADYEARVSEARAALASAQARSEAAQSQLTLTRATTAARLQEAQSQVAVAEAALANAKAQVVVARSDAQRAKADLRRYSQVRGNGGVSEQQFEHTQLETEATEARMQAAVQQVSEAEASLGAANARLSAAEADLYKVQVDEAHVRTAVAQARQAKAALDQTELDLGYTIIRAPVAGHIANKSIDVGEYVQPGQTLMAVVPQEMWIEANFKETQLTHMRPGQSVIINIDTYPGIEFRGHVESIQRGTGAVFSLLPPENATGNYVKIVQRIPVKILFDEFPDPKQYIMAQGMSVVPEVHVSESPGTVHASVTNPNQELIQNPTKASE